MQPEAIPDESLLRSCLIDEEGCKVVVFRSANSLKFSDPKSSVSQLKWDSNGYRALARELQRPIDRLVGRVPASAVQQCIEVCASFQTSRLARYGLRALVKQGKVVGAAHWLAVQTFPSTIARSLLGFPPGSVKIQYLDCNLTAWIVNQKGHSNPCWGMKAIRAQQSLGYALEHTKLTWTRSLPSRSGKFSRYAGGSLEGLLFSIKAELGLS